ncbi:MAG TPA: hypothetical protein VE961_10080 [Pyrinomonadaceae bacterium]|nr:hypothetical protein [Pyrinomonadaceae bacterium]
MKKESDSRKSSRAEQLIEDAKALSDATDELREIGKRVAEESEVPLTTPGLHGDR